MGAGETKPKKPLKDGLFKMPSSPEDKGYLIGRRCKDCDSYFFPNFMNPSQKAVCAVCYSENMEDTPLSTQGRIWTYSIVHSVYPYTALPAPIISAVIELPEQVALTTAIVGCEPDEVKIGMEVELDFIKVADSKDGNEIIAFVFKPVRR